MVILGQRRTLPFIYLGLSIASYPIWFSNFFSNAPRIQQNAIFCMLNQSPFKGYAVLRVYSSVLWSSNDGVKGGHYPLSSWACHLLKITVDFLNTSGMKQMYSEVRQLHHFAYWFWKFSGDDTRTPLQGLCSTQHIGLNYWTYVPKLVQSKKPQQYHDNWNYLL